MRARTALPMLQFALHQRGQKRLSGTVKGHTDTVWSFCRVGVVRRVQARSAPPRTPNRLGHEALATRRTVRKGRP